MSAWNTQNPRMSLIALIGLLFSVLLPSAASAYASVGKFVRDLRTICEGDCAKQADLEARRQSAGFDQPFELGLKVLEEGLDLTIKSDGNILIYGALNVSDSAAFNAGSSTLNAAEIVIGGDVTLLAVGAPRLVLAESGLRGASLDLFAEAAGIASAVGLDAPRVSPPGIVISRSGDIYLDVSMSMSMSMSMAGLDRLTVSAGKSLFIVGSDSLPVPEPGTGLLFGLGLISLAAIRTRNPVFRATQATL